MSEMVTKRSQIYKFHNKLFSKKIYDYCCLNEERVERTVFILKLFACVGFLKYYFH